MSEWFVPLHTLLVPVSIVAVQSNRFICENKASKYVVLFSDKIGQTTHTSVPSVSVHWPRVGIEEKKSPNVYYFNHRSFNPAVFGNQKTTHNLYAASQRSYSTRSNDPPSFSSGCDTRSTKDDSTHNDGVHRDTYYDKYVELFSQVPRSSNEDERTVRSQCIDAGLSDNETEKRLTHTDDHGGATMVQVGDKPETKRVAMAAGKVLLGHKAFQLVWENRSKKGDVLTVAQIAGIMAAKDTGRMIPLCHNISLTKVDVTLTLCSDDYSVLISCEAHTRGQTGVEMESLVGVSVAALTVYDMCKAVTHDIVITDVRLENKRGGQRGNYERDPHC